VLTARLIPFSSSPPHPSNQINREKCFVVVQAGVTLNRLHTALGTLGLAMSNLGSISDQTLAGVITTATHGSGVNYGVISTDVLALGLLLADGTVARCSRTENPDLFIASLCGLGSTGLLISVTLQVEPAFHLKEVGNTISLDETIRDLDDLAGSGEHVRMWWFPQTEKVRLYVADRTREVRCGYLSSHNQLILNNIPASAEAADWKLVLGLFRWLSYPPISPLSLAVVSRSRLLDRSTQGLAHRGQVRSN